MNTPTLSRSPSATRSSVCIDDGWILSPEIEALLARPSPAINVSPVAPDRLTKKPNKDVGKVDLNSATVDELCSLPGIGRGRAKQIVSWRSENGPFESPAALLAISGIGARTLEALTPLLA